MSNTQKQWFAFLSCLFLFISGCYEFADTENRTTSGSDREQRVLMILVWVRLIASGTARLARKAKRSVRVTLGTSSWQPRYSTSVCSKLMCVFVSLLKSADKKCIGFLTKIKKILETVCHNCGKIKAKTVSHPCRDGKSCYGCFADLHSG